MRVKTLLMWLVSILISSLFWILDSVLTDFHPAPIGINMKAKMLTFMTEEAEGELEWIGNELIKSLKNATLKLGSSLPKYLKDILEGLPDDFKNALKIATKSNAKMVKEEVRAAKERFDENMTEMAREVMEDSRYNDPDSQSCNIKDEEDEKVDSDEDGKQSDFLDCSLHTWNILNYLRYLWLFRMSLIIQDVSNNFGSL